MPNETVQISGRHISDVVGLKDSFVAQGYLVNWCASNENPPYVLVDKDSSETKPIATVVTAFQDAGKIAAVSDKAAGFDGVPECAGDGVEKHTLSISIKDFSGVLMPVATNLQVCPSVIVAVSNAKPVVVAGLASVQIGPVSGVGDIEVRICDQAMKHWELRYKVRFI
jgi:hypothetical protein